VARARLVAAQARLREAEANTIRTSRDVERLRGLLAKDEVSQQQFDATVSAADAAKAAADTLRAFGHTVGPASGDRLATALARADRVEVWT